MERKLVERAVKGDYEAFTALVEASAPRQFAVASLILHDPDKARDAVQEALVSAWRGIGALRDADAWDAWLHRLTVRACYTEARRARRRTLIEVQAALEHQPLGAVDVPSALAERDRVERELKRLPIDQRVVLVLHFFVGLRVGEVAAVLGIPAGTAKSRLHRGLETLRRTMLAEPDIVNRVAQEHLT
jgi:RNA polymerase sigma-70 factor (ECF subfamily)